ncbi:hypothetical protein N9B54_03615 [Mariniblastus sp.]|nr:hypothetical protein [Mariniblastus sp.]
MNNKLLCHKAFKPSDNQHDTYCKKEGTPHVSILEMFKLTGSLDSSTIVLSDSASGVRDFIAPQSYQCYRPNTNYIPYPSQSNKPTQTNFRRSPGVPSRFKDFPSDFGNQTVHKYRDFSD